MALPPDYLGSFNRGQYNMSTSDRKDDEYFSTRRLYGRLFNNGILLAGALVLGGAINKSARNYSDRISIQTKLNMASLHPTEFPPLTYKVEPVEDIIKNIRDRQSILKNGGNAIHFDKLKDPPGYYFGHDEVKIIKQVDKGAIQETKDLLQRLFKLSVNVDMATDDKIAVDKRGMMRYIIGDKKNPKFEINMPLVNRRGLFYLNGRLMAGHNYLHSFDREGVTLETFYQALVSNIETKANDKNVRRLMEAATKGDLQSAEEVQTIFNRVVGTFLSEAEDVTGRGPLKIDSVISNVLHRDLKAAGGYKSSRRIRALENKIDEYKAYIDNVAESAQDKRAAQNEINMLEGRKNAAIKQLTEGEILNVYEENVKRFAGKKIKVRYRDNVFPETDMLWSTVVGNLYKGKYGPAIDGWSFPEERPSQKKLIDIFPSVYQWKNYDDVAKAIGPASMDTWQRLANNYNNMGQASILNETLFMDGEIFTGGVGLTVYKDAEGLKQLEPLHGITDMRSARIRDASSVIRDEGFIIGYGVGQYDKYAIEQRYKPGFTLSLGRTKGVLKLKDTHYRIYKSVLENRLIRARKKEDIVNLRKQRWQSRNRMNKYSRYAISNLHIATSELASIRNYMRDLIGEMDPMQKTGFKPIDIITDEKINDVKLKQFIQNYDKQIKSMEAAASQRGINKKTKSILMDKIREAKKYRRKLDRNLSQIGKIESFMTADKRYSDAKKAIKEVRYNTNKELFERIVKNPSALEVNTGAEFKPEDVIYYKDDGTPIRLNQLLRGTEGGKIKGIHLNHKGEVVFDFMEIEKWGAAAKDGHKDMQVVMNQQEFVEKMGILGTYEREKMGSLFFAHNMDKLTKQRFDTKSTILMSIFSDFYRIKQLESKGIKTFSNNDKKVLKDIFKVVYGADPDKYLDLDNLVIDDKKNLLIPALKKGTAYTYSEPDARLLFNNGKIDYVQAERINEIINKRFDQHFQRTGSQYKLVYTTEELSRQNMKNIMGGRFIVDKAPDDLEGRVLRAWLVSRTDHLYQSRTQLYKQTTRPYISLGGAKEGSILDAFHTISMQAKGLTEYTKFIQSIAAYSAPYVKGYEKVLRYLPTSLMGEIGGRSITEDMIASGKKYLQEGIMSGKAAFDIEDIKEMGWLETGLRKRQTFGEIFDIDKIEQAYISKGFSEEQAKSMAADLNTISRRVTTLSKKQLENYIDFVNRTSGAVRFGQVQGVRLGGQTFRVSEMAAPILDIRRDVVEVLQEVMDTQGNINKEVRYVLNSTHSSFLRTMQTLMDVDATADDKSAIISRYYTELVEKQLLGKGGIYNNLLGKQRMPGSMSAIARSRSTEIGKLMMQDQWIDMTNIKPGEVYIDVDNFKGMVKSAYFSVLDDRKMKAELTQSGRKIMDYSYYGYEEDYKEAIDIMKKHSIIDDSGKLIIDPITGKPISPADIPDISSSQVKKIQELTTEMRNANLSYEQVWKRNAYIEGLVDDIKTNRLSFKGMIERKPNIGARTSSIVNIKLFDMARIADKYKGTDKEKLVREAKNYIYDNVLIQKMIQGDFDRDMVSLFITQLEKLGLSSPMNIEEMSHGKVRDMIINSRVLNTKMTGTDLRRSYYSGTSGYITNSIAQMIDEMSVFGEPSKVGLNKIVEDINKVLESPEFNIKGINVNDIIRTTSLKEAIQDELKGTTLENDSDAINRIIKRITGSLEEQDVDNLRVITGFQLPQTVEDIMKMTGATLNDKQVSELKENMFKLYKSTVAVGKGKDLTDGELREQWDDIYEQTVKYYEKTKVANVSDLIGLKTTTPSAYKFSHIRWDVGQQMIDNKHNYQSYMRYVEFLQQVQQDVISGKHGIPLIIRGVRREFRRLGSKEVGVSADARRNISRGIYQVRIDQGDKEIMQKLGLLDERRFNPYTTWEYTRYNEAKIRVIDDVLRMRSGEINQEQLIKKVEEIGEELNIKKYDVNKWLDTFSSENGIDIESNTLKSIREQAIGRKKELHKLIGGMIIPDSENLSQFKEEVKVGLGVKTDDELNDLLSNSMRFTDNSADAKIQLNIARANKDMLDTAMKVEKFIADNKAIGLDPGSPDYYQAIMGAGISAKNWNSFHFIKKSMTQGTKSSPFLTHIMGVKGVNTTPFRSGDDFKPRTILKRNSFWENLSEKMGDTFRKKFAMRPGQKFSIGPALGAVALGLLVGDIATSTILGDSSPIPQMVGRGGEYYESTSKKMSELGYNYNLGKIQGQLAEVNPNIAFHQQPVRISMENKNGKWMRTKRDEEKENYRHRYYRYNYGNHSYTKSFNQIPFS